MEQKFKILGIDCANCAAKMERAIGKIDGIDRANLSFMTQKLIIETDLPQTGDIVEKMTKICKKIDRHVQITPIR
ncbi:MAG TPA: heavy metal-associated domain-containing protein [Thermotogota bacterium]|nr:heavy metal-associated domain-containing protein [Thermotogota bacterium]HPJ88596.1 heavy metal-associated domain-containing protein [Thermotogota bacterium]HPR96664.1 heavy metal-associated domain-containing protein [Thermotogota bacterium]